MAPDFTPRTAPDDLSQAPTFEGQLLPYADYSLQEDDEEDARLGPLLPLKDPAPHELPQPNIVRHVETLASNLTSFLKLTKGNTTLVFYLNLLHVPFHCFTFFDLASFYSLVCSSCAFQSGLLSLSISISLFDKIFSPSFGFFLFYGCYS